MSAMIKELRLQIEEDFKRRLPGYHKARAEGLALLVSLMLALRSVNLMELAQAVPRKIKTKDHRYQFIERILGNPHIDTDAVMQPYSQEIIQQLTQKGQTLVIMMDQSKINALNQVLMLSVSLRERALPLVWRVRPTQGNIGFETQEELLNSFLTHLPPGIRVLLVADRFYGTPRLVSWCQEAGWGYRIRLKGNLLLQHEGRDLKTGDVAKLSPLGLEGAIFSSTGVRTNIGILQEKGHPEPWIIAMDSKPSPYTTFDYGLRWGIEPMFSDGKSRGFRMDESQIQRPDKLERLLLIIALAMYRAVSCGAYDEWKNNTIDDKKRGTRNATYFCVNCSNADAACCCDT